MKIALSFSCLLLAGIGGAQALVYQDNEICRVQVDIGPWNMTNSNPLNQWKYKDLPAEITDPTKIVSMSAIIYTDPIGAGSITKAYPFNRLKMTEDGTAASGGTYGLGGNLYYSKDPGGAMKIVLNRGGAAESFFAKANIPDGNGNLMNFAIGTTLNRGVVTIEYKGVKKQMGAQADSTALFPLGSWDMLDQEDYKYVPYNFGTSGNTILTAREILQAEATMYSNLDLQQNQTVDRLGRLGGNIWDGASQRNTWRGNLPIVEDQGATSGWVFGRVIGNTLSITKQFFRGICGRTYSWDEGYASYPSVCPDGGERGEAKSPYVTLPANRGWHLIRYKGLKIGSTFGGYSTVGTPFPYAIKSKVLVINNWQMDQSLTYPGYTGTTKTLARNFSLIEMNINYKRILNFRMMVLSNPDGAGKVEVFPMEMLAFAAPPGFAAAGGSGRPYYIRQNGLHVGFGGSAEMFSANARFSGGYTGTRAFLKVDYLAAQCDEPNGAFTNHAVIGGEAKGYECGGATASTVNGDGVIQASGTGLSTTGKSDNIVFRSYTRTNQSLTFTARLDNVEKTADNAQFGISVRASTAANAAHTSIVVTPNSGLRVVSRNATDGFAVTKVVGSTSPILRTPVWVRITKTGNSCLTQYKTDTGNWTAVWTFDCIMPATYRFGMIAGSGTTQPYPMTGSASSMSY